MKQIKHLINISLPSVALLLAVSCATQKVDKVITASPAPCVIMPDSINNAQIDVTLNIPSNYIPKRSRIVITPQLVSGDSVVEQLDAVAIYSPIYSKKVERAAVLKKQIDPYYASAIRLKSTAEAIKVPYADYVELPDDIDNARIVGVISVDGCGECSGIDTLEIAAVGSPITLIVPKEELKVVWLEPEFKVRPKIMEGRGEAKMQFAVNRYDINLDMGNNRGELEEMRAKLGPILADTLATVNSLDIFGKASAEGSLAINIPLARNRANSAKQWLVKELNIAPEVQMVIRTGSRPEGWQPVLDAMIADNHPDASKVKEIMDRYADQNDDVAERYIRRLPCWNDIKAKYLQKDRKVEYVYTYTIRSFTNDAELIDMYKKRPDAFNEDELLRVAALAVDDNSRKDVYLTLTKYFPQSAVAANNLAVIYMNEDNIEDARKALETQKEFTPEQLSTLASSYIYTGDFEKAIELLQEIDLPEARYNLGLLKARQRKLNEAYELLRPYNDVNTAITALSLNRNDEAAAIMNSIDNDAPLTAYVKALVAARQSDKTLALSHLAKACAVDNNLRRRAADEPDFFGYRNDPDFLSIINK